MLPFTLIALAGPLAADITPEEIRALPRAAGRHVDFLREVHPLLAERCSQCHAGGKDRGGLRIDSRELLLKGGKSGPAVVVGKSEASLLVHLVAGLDPKRVMPKQGPRLGAEEVGILRAWIDQGLSWEKVAAVAPEPASGKRTREADLALRRPEIPGGASDPGENPIDLFLAPYFKKHGFTPPPPVDDRAFLRRVSLDALGLLPSPAEAEEFLSRPDPGNRRRLVRRLLGQSREYTEHWLTFWNDLLRNDYRGTGYIDGGRKQITSWLYGALARNLPYDRMVRELIDPTDESSGFLKGIVWRGVTNASQTPALQAAQNLSQVFMGINLKCASCHDSFINDWTLREAYGLAGIFAEGPLEMVRCDAPTGEVAPMQFIYPALGALDPAAPRGERLARLAEVVTGKQNGRLPRTIVNRLWARFFGRGLIDPVDDMEGPAWNDDLLTWLARDLVDGGWDLKRTMERMLASRAYALPAVPLDERDRGSYVFRGPVVRRLSAEQFFDALASLTGAGHGFPEARPDFSVLAESGDPRYQEIADAPAEASWIWGEPAAAPPPGPETIYLRRRATLPAAPSAAVLVGACEGGFTLFVNGRRAASGQGVKRPVLADLLPHLRAGENTLAVEAVSRTPGSPAGLLLYFRVRGGGRAMDFATGGEWLASAAKAEGWEKPGFAPEGWAAARTLGSWNAAPWRAGPRLAALLWVAADAGRFRAALLSADPLLLALGRPNREQVVSTRASTATTLEALELTNGETLAAWLRRGAEKLLEAGPAPARDLALRLHEHALGRRPSREELAVAEEVLGDPAGREGIEDYLWCLLQLPEFQLIR